MNHIRHVFLMLAFTASMLFWASIAVTPAAAASITYYFSGQVDKVQNQLQPSKGGIFSVNLSPSAMSGFIVVNKLDANTSSSVFGEYTIKDFDLKIFNTTIGTYNATWGTGTSSGLVEIRNGLSGQDQFNVSVSSPIGSSVNGFSLSSFDILLHGPGNTFNPDSDALPTTPPSIGDFDKKNVWHLVFGAGGKSLSGPVMALTAVPLPAAVILFGAGLVALVGLGAGSWRQKKNSLA